MKRLLQHYGAEYSQPFKADVKQSASDEHRVTKAYEGVFTDSFQKKNPDTTFAGSTSSGARAALAEGTSAANSSVGKATFNIVNSYAPPVQDIEVKKEWENEEVTDSQGNVINYAKKTRPDKVEFELYYKFDSGSKTKISNSADDKKYLGTTAAAYNATPLKHLPLDGTADYYNTFEFTTMTNETVGYDDLYKNVNPDGTEIWNGVSYPITYYVDEVRDDYLSKAYTMKNDKESGFTLGEDIETVTITNSLVRKKITVNKIWDDGEYAQNRGSTHYDVKADVILKDDTSVKQTLLIPDDTATVTTGNGGGDNTGNTNNSGTQAPQNVAIVPLYIKNGNTAKLAEYTVKETTYHYGYVGSYDQKDDEKVEGVSAERKDFIGSDSSAATPLGIDLVNFSHEEKADPNDQNSETVTVHDLEVTIKNTLPLIYLKVEKTWDDDKNRDGLRPESIKFTLTRTPAQSTKDIDKVTLADKPETPEEGHEYKTITINPSISDKFDTAIASVSSQWRADFGYHLLKDYSNTNFKYSVTEANDTVAANVTDRTSIPNATLGLSNYTVTAESLTTLISVTNRTSSSWLTIVGKDGMGSYKDDEGNTVVVKKDDPIREAVDIGYFNVENQYTPQKGELKVTKTWAGETINGHNYADKTRPEKIKFTLQVSYEKKDNKDVWVDADKTLLSLSDTYALVKEVDTSNDNATEFNAIYSDLPLYINPTFNDDPDDPNKDLTNGKSVPIKYRVKEEVVNAGESLKGYTEKIEGADFSEFAGKELTVNSTTDLAVTNTLKRGSVTITKVWDDQGAVALADYSKYHYNVQIIVQSDDVGYNTGTNPSTETITTPNTDTTSTPLTLNDLPLYTKKGDPAKYYASEVSVDGDKIVKKYGYKSSYEVFYTHTKLDTDGNPIQKKDEQGNPVVDAQDNPVYETEELVYTYTAQMPALNSWGLPIIDSNGSLATQDLTLDRVLIPGDDEPKNSLTITNTLPVVELELHNYWNDQQNQDGKRPESAEFTLRRYRNITNGGSETITEIPVSSDTQGAEIFSDTTTVNQNAIGTDSSNKGYWLGTFTKTENNQTVTKRYPYYDEANKPYVYFIDDSSKVKYNSQAFADYNSTLKHQYSITGITTRQNGENVTYGKIKGTYTQPDTTKLVYKGCFDVTNTYTPLTKTINVETT